MSGFFLCILFCGLGRIMVAAVDILLFTYEGIQSESCRQGNIEQKRYSILYKCT